MTYEHKCRICGAADAPFGFGFAGHRSKLPADKRGILWACGACEPQARARWERANAGPIGGADHAGDALGEGQEQGRKQRATAGSAVGKRRVTPPDAGQGALEL